ncbi:hypothetical protein D3C87_1692750 [compost metagenome]
MLALVPAVYGVVAAAFVYRFVTGVQVTLLKFAAGEFTVKVVIAVLQTVLSLVTSNAGAGVTVAVICCLGLSQIF